MPEHLRALVFILILANATFAATRSVFLSAISQRTFKRWWMMWNFVTLLAFLSASFWLYAAVLIVVLAIVSRVEENPEGLYFVLLFAVPVGLAPVGGFGSIESLFEMNHVRLLNLVLLMPAAMALAGSRRRGRRGQSAADLFMMGFLLLTALLGFRDTTPTNGLRKAAYLFVDVFLPYVCISRLLITPQHLWRTAAAFVMACIALAPIAVFETLRYWNLYSAAADALGMRESNSYLTREQMLRAAASTGNSIALGLVFVVGLGLSLALRRRGKGGSMFFALAGLLGMGLIAALSRGPWVGAAVLLLAYISLGRAVGRGLVALSAAGLFAVVMLLSLPGGSRVFDFLPFVGSVDAAAVTYRQDLFQNSLAVIKRTPLLGSSNYLEAPEMRVLIQGEDFIDVTNSYVQVALNSGLVGLGLYVGVFAAALLGVRRAMRAPGASTSEAFELGRVLIACMVAVLVILATVSSVSVIPTVYWSLAAMAAAYPGLMRASQKAQHRGGRQHPLRESQASTDSEFVGPMLPSRGTARRNRNPQ